MIKPGDLVVVVMDCERDPRCREDFGLMFKVREVSTSQGGKCNWCALYLQVGAGIVRHPESVGNPRDGNWIPMAWLKKIDPPQAAIIDQLILSVLLSKGDLLV